MEKFLSLPDGCLTFHRDRDQGFLCSPEGYHRFLDFALSYADGFSMTYGGPPRDDAEYQDYLARYEDAPEGQAPSYFAFYQQQYGTLPPPVRTIQEFRSSQWAFLSGSVTDWEITHETAVTSSRERYLLLYFRIDPVTRQFLCSKGDIYDFRRDSSFLEPVRQAYQRRQVQLAQELMASDDIQARLRAWDWLEDLAFFKDGQIFFASCTHEGFCRMDPAAHSLYWQGCAPELPLDPVREQFRPLDGRRKV